MSHDWPLVLLIAIVVGILIAGVLKGWWVAIIFRARK
jgi:hypothetical protein